MSKDSWESDAAFIASVSGQRLERYDAASVLHPSAEAESFSFTGSWDVRVNGAGPNSIDFACGGLQSEHHDLHANATPENGIPCANSNDPMFSDATARLAMSGATSTTSAAMQMTTGQPYADATLSFIFIGNWETCTDRVSGPFANDVHGRSAGEDRTLYIQGVAVNGTDVVGGFNTQYDRAT